jgi:hypothetical protein
MMIRVHGIRRVRTVLLWAACLMVGPAARGGTPVEELTKRLPDGVVGFAATSGGEALKGDFEKTSLGRIWNDPGVRSFYQEIKTQLLAKLQEQGGKPELMQQVNMALGMAQLVARRPLVLGVASLKGPVRIKEKVPVYAFAFLEAGTRKAEFEALVKKLESLAGADTVGDVNIGSAKMRGPKDQRDLSLYWGWSGDYFVVAGNDAEGATLQYLQKPRGTVPDYLKKVPVGGDALVVHADLQKTISLIDTSIRQEDVKTAGVVSAVLKELGLSGVKTFTSRVGFAGPDVVTGSFLEVAPPRTGLLAALKPLDPTMMDLVDARAVAATAANLDLAGVYDAILRAVKAGSGAAYVKVEKGLADFEAEVKLNLRKNLLESLAGPVVFYTVGPGAVPESPLGGSVALVKLKDAGLFEKTITDLGGYAAARSQGILQVSEQKRDDGRTVHTWVVPQLALMQVMPTWSLANGYVVIGSNAALHDLTLQQMALAAGDRKSIRDTPGYKEATARLPGNLLSLSYTDSRAQYTQLTTVLQQVWPMMAMLAAQQNIKLPTMLPALGEIIKDMKPSCRSYGAGPDGIYMQYQGPGVEVSVSSVAEVSLAMGILMPALARVRQLSFRMTSGQNLVSVGRACRDYAQDHNGKLPPDLQTLVKEMGLAPHCLESKLKPKDFDGPSYIYIAGQTLAMNPENIIVYENPEYSVDGVNVLFLDGQAMFIKREGFPILLKATCERLGRPMPEIKFQGEVEVQPRPPRPVRPARPAQA